MLPAIEVPHGVPAAALEAQSAQPPDLLLSQAADIPQALVASLRLEALQSDTAPGHAQADTAAPSTAVAPEQVPGKPKLAPGEKPPRIAEYHWYAAEPKDGVAEIGFGHPKRQRGGEFLVGFNCRLGSGKATFVMFEVGSSRSQFTKGQKVAVTLEIGSVKAPLQGVVDANEGISFPMASATIPVDDALFKVMDDDVKVLRIDIDGWSAAVQLILIKEVMPAFSKACAKKKKPETTAQAPVTAPAKVPPPAESKAPPGAAPAQAEPGSQAPQ